MSELSRTTWVVAFLAALFVSPWAWAQNGFRDSHPVVAEARSEFITTALMEDGKPVRLELLVQKPEGSGPFPAVVFNHGSTGLGNKPELFRISWSSATLARYFVERGWMVIFPQRRGRGASEGRYDEGFETDRSRYSCKTSLALAGVERAIEDLGAVMAHVKARTDVQRNRILLGGQSRGGILAMAYAGENPDAFIGVINFVGGWVVEHELCPNATEINATTFKRGAKYSRSTLWLYGEQDPFYSLSHSKANFAAFLSAGGTGRFESYRLPDQISGHTLIAYPGLWAGQMTQYLDSLK